jgi:hypothetical protein
LRPVSRRQWPFPRTQNESVTYAEEKQSFGGRGKTGGAWFARL